MNSPKDFTRDVSPYRANPKSLLVATVAALLGAIVILVLFVAPAEWGIDLTGAGKVLGLTRMASEGEDDSNVQASAPTLQPGLPLAESFEIPLQIKERIEARAILRSDEHTIVLEPHTGTEIKAHMVRGDHLIFRWTSSAPVRMDMHGEPVIAGPDDFSSYWKERNLTQAQGQFTAPFDGTHGWYWRNGGETPVSITLHTSGFYADLFEPNTE